MLMTAAESNMDWIRSGEDGKEKKYYSIHTRYRLCGQGDRRCESAGFTFNLLKILLLSLSKICSKNGKPMRKGASVLSSVDDPQFYPQILWINCCRRFHVLGQGDMRPSGFFRMIAALNSVCASYCANFQSLVLYC
jgi:hypothetical protein